MERVTNPVDVTETKPEEKQREARPVEQEMELFPFGANPGVKFGRD